MGDVARPILAEVLAALTGVHYWPRRVVLGMGVNHVSSIHDTGGCVTDAPWLHTDAAEAQEALSQHGLLPDGWCGDVRRGWYCEACDSYGTQRIATTMYPLGTREIPCERCGGGPRTTPDLVAVASLGWTAIDCAEELAREACRALREYGCPQPQRVVWMVGERRRRRGQWVPIAWTAPGGSIPAFSDVFSVDGFWFPEHGPEVPIPSAIALWGMGLALDAIDRDAVRIVVPPVGGGRG